MTKGEEAQKLFEPDWTKVYDRCGELDALYAYNKNWLDEREEIRKSLRAKAASEDVSKPVEYHGTTYIVRLSPCRNERRVNPLVLAKRIRSSSRVLTIASVTSKALDGLKLTVSQLLGVITESQTGAREIETVRIPKKTA